MRDNRIKKILCTIINIEKSLEEVHCGHHDHDEREDADSATGHVHCEATHHQGGDGASCGLPQLAILQTFILCDLCAVGGAAASGSGVLPTRRVFQDGRIAHLGLGIPVGSLVSAVTIIPRKVNTPIQARHCF